MKSSYNKTARSNHNQQDLIYRAGTPAGYKKAIVYYQSQPDEIGALLQLFYKSPVRLSHAAGKVLGGLAIETPELIKKHLTVVIRSLQTTLPPGTLRNVIRILQFIEIPKVHTGTVYERCFELISLPETPNATRVFALTVCSNIALKYPEMIPEVISIIEQLQPYGTPAFLSRSRKIMHQLKSLRSVLPS